MILVLVIAFLVTLILVVSISSFVTKTIFNKKEEKEERKYDIESLEENGALSAEIKEANKEQKKQASKPQGTNKFVINQPEIKPQPIINNNIPESSAPEPSESPVGTTPNENTKEETASTEPQTIDPFNLNNNQTTNNTETEVFK